MNGGPKIYGRAYSDNEKNNEIKMFEIASKRYEFEFQRSKDLDSKAGNLIGYVGIITTLILGIGTFELFENPTRIEYYLIYFAGIIAFIFSISFSLFAIKIRKYRFSPQYEDMLDFYRNPNKDHRLFIRTNIKEMIESFRENFIINNQKGKWILYGWFCFLIGVVLLLAFTIAVTHLNTVIDEGQKSLNNTLTTLIIEKLYMGENSELEEIFISNS